MDRTNMLARLNSDFKEKVIEGLVKRFTKKREKQIRRIIDGFHIEYSAEVHAHMAAAWEKAFPYVLGKTVDQTPKDVDEKLQSLRGNKPVIFVPDHRSNLDAPVVNFFLNKKGLLPVNIAGTNLKGDKADNLSRVNVFFLERRMRELPKELRKLYLPCAVAYLQSVAWNAVNNELVFIEGGRSYSGILNQKLVESDEKSRASVGTLVGHLHSDSVEVYVCPMSQNYVWVGEDKELMKHFRKGQIMPKVDLIENCLELEGRLKSYEDFSVYIRCGMPRPLEHFISEAEESEYNKAFELQLALIKAISRERIHFPHQVLARTILEAGKINLEQVSYDIASGLQASGFILTDEFYDEEGNLDSQKILEIGRRRLESRGIIAKDFLPKDRDLLEFYANQCTYNEKNS